MSGTLRHRASSEHRMIAIAAALALVSSAVVAGHSSHAEEKTGVDRDEPSLAVRAEKLLAARCGQCHGERKRESGLDLRTTTGALEGGESGPAVVAGSAEKSLLYERLASGEMPPREADRFNADELALVREWINHGARAASTAGSAAEAFAARKAHWSFARPVRPDVPQVTTPEGEPAAPIDAFVLAKLRDMNLTPAPLADRRTLARRAYFDLLGLPPPPERVEKFVADTDPQAYEKLVDELLASPRYGERWARHWLDVARYADTGGYETDIYFKNAWRYRDYVVKSFNDDKPYNIFVQEQIAADQLWPDNLELDGTYIMPSAKVRHLEARLGTGLFALGPQIHESNMDGAKLRNERLSDWVDTAGAAFLGLTIGCARCHDHKFDAITQRDYYGMQAIFAGAKEVDLPIINAMEIADTKQHYPRVLAVDEARKAYRQFEQSHGAKKLTTEEEARKQELLAAIGRAVLAVPEKAASSPGTPFDGILEIPTASVLADEQTELVPTIHLLARGEVTRPKEAIAPQLPEALAEKTGREPALSGATGSRKELALWLTSPENPLTARVIVNRIWGWHFGRGIVATPSDFGRMGQPPTHPALLDYLATQFVEQGWSIKALHRTIMLSRTYRQASDYQTAAHAAADPESRFLWRMNRRRLEAESLWDAIHSVAGTLNEEMGGRPVMPPLAGEEQTDKANWVVNADPKQHTRRGLYILVRRNFRFPLFDIFDAPVNAVSCAGRDVSTVAPQALWLLNNHVAYGQSRQLAARVVREAGSDPSAWVDRAWHLCLQRSPTAEELREANEFLALLVASHEPSKDAGSLPAELAPLPAAQALALDQFCLTLLNLHEFLFID